VSLGIRGEKRLNTTGIEEVCAEPCAQYTSNVEKTVFITENTTESRSSVNNMFHNVVEKRKPYEFKNRYRRPEPTPASLLYPP
jgi:hypothetical protein